MQIWFQPCKYFTKNMGGHNHYDDCMTLNRFFETSNRGNRVCKCKTREIVLVLAGRFELFNVFFSMGPQGDCLAQVTNWFGQGCSPTACPNNSYLFNCHPFVSWPCS